MADVRISDLPAPIAVSLTDRIPSTQSDNVTRRLTVGDMVTGTTGIPPAQITFTATVPLNRAGGHMAAQTVAGALTFTAAASPVDGASCTVKLTADGTNTPNFSAFTKAGSSSWVNTAATVNLVTFFRIGGTNFYSVIQA